MLITRRVEFDAGHRIPFHESKCRNAHGHRYVLEVSASGEVKGVRGESDDGMVMDFSVLKRVATEAVAEPWDHAFLVWSGDISMLTALDTLGRGGVAHKTVVLSKIPTVENLVGLAFEQIALANPEVSKFIRRIKMFETPNCWAQLDF